MPGVIIRWEVKVGDQVKEDQPILVLEAMKMENVISSPMSGTVKAINFKAGDHVERDAVMLVIE